MIDMSTNRSHLCSLLLIAAFLALLLLLRSLNDPYSIDEFEHIHSGWYVNTGHIPYSDFFQHHNPLLWYLMVPVFRVFGETVESLIAVRLLIFLFTMGIASLTYLISRTLTDSKEAGLFSVILLLSMVKFVLTVIQIRCSHAFLRSGLDLLSGEVFSDEQEQTHYALGSVRLDLISLFAEDPFSAVRIRGDIRLPRVQEEDLDKGRSSRCTCWRTAHFAIMC